MAEKKHATKERTIATLGGDLVELGWLGHIIPVKLGLASLVAAFYAWRADIQVTLVVALVIAGVFLPYLAWRSLHRSRAAWAFLISLSSVLAMMTLFGAPKIRNLVGIPLGAALVIPALLAFAVFALSLQDRRYKNQG